jgi:hypothetical protein
MASQPLLLPVDMRERLPEDDLVFVVAGRAGDTAGTCGAGRTAAAAGRRPDRLVAEDQACRDAQRAKQEAWVRP